MYCPNCGQATSTEQKFCRACGLSLEKVAQSLVEQLRRYVLTVGKMMMLPFSAALFLFVMICVTGCSLAPQSSLASDKYQISEITLERSGSWGIRSGYKVVLRKDGTAEYAGDIHAKREGKYHGAISTDQFEPLTRVIIDNDYFSLKDKYHALVTDTDTVTTTIVYSGGRKRVEDFGRGGGASLTKIEQEIDKVAEQIAWVEDEARFPNPK